jgi:hypothetical protein
VKTKQLVAIGAGGLAALALIWYLALSPSTGAAVEPGPSELALTAAQSGTGSWVRYVITLKNLGGVPFNGDVVLLNRTDTPAGPGPVRLPPMRVTPSVFGPVGTAAVPAVPTDSAYQVHLQLPGRHETGVSIFAPPDYVFVEARDNRGHTIAHETVDHTDTVPVAVFSGGAIAGSQLTEVTLGDSALSVFSFDRGRTVPTDAALLATYSTIVLDQFDTGSLSRQQLQALRDFVGLGGNLVVVAGGSWRSTVLPLPPDLLPLIPNGTASSSLAGVPALNGRSIDVHAPVARGTLRPGARTVLAEEGHPLVSELDYGAGQVVELAFDPAAAPLVGTKTAIDAWTQAVGRGLVVTGGHGAGTRTLLGPESLPLDLFPPALDSPLPSPWLVGPLLLAYLLLVAPVNYLFLRQRLHRPALVWISTPLIALLFAGSFYTIGGALQGTLRDNEFQLMKVAPDGTVADFEYNQVLFPVRGNHRLELSPGALIVPMTLQTYEDFAGTCESCLIQLAGVQVGEEHVLPGRQPIVTERGVAYGSVRILGSAAVRHRPLGVVASLKITGGLLMGTVQNAGHTALHGLAVYTFDGLSYERVPIPDLPPGATVKIAAAPNTVTATRGPPAGDSAREQVLGRAIAMAALAQNPQPVLVGFTDLAPGKLLVDGMTPVRAGLAAVEQPLLIEGADSMLAQWSRVRLAGISGSLKDGFRNVYDIELPPGTGAFDLAYNSRTYGSVELYDWAAGAWRAAAGVALTAGTPGRVSVSIGAAVLQDGLVRVRVNEARVSWGADFVLPS